MSTGPNAPTAPPYRGDIFGVTLAFVAGYVDTVVFVALFGLFTAHVTGNFVLIGSELANPSHGVLIKLLAFPAFILAVVVARLIVTRAELAGRTGARPLLALQGTLLLGSMATGWLALPIADSRSTWALMAGVLAAAAMGVQNAASRLVWSSLSPTTVMTGNVTQLTIDLVDLAHRPGHDDIRQRVHRFLWPVVAFGVGAVAGAFAFREFSFPALVAPVVLIGVLMTLAGQPSRLTREARRP
jgi:uncharacterized membrane protein YoaK (UPF0700 family)